MPFESKHYPIRMDFIAKSNQNKIGNINKIIKGQRIRGCSTSRLFLLDPRFFNKK